MLETLARENPAAAWEKVRDLLRERMSFAAYEQRLKPVRFVSLEGSQMTLEAADEFSAPAERTRRGPDADSRNRCV